MKIVAITASLTGIMMVLLREPVAAGIAFAIAVVFALAARADDNNWHRH